MIVLVELDHHDHIECSDSSTSFVNLSSNTLSNYKKAPGPPTSRTVQKVHSLLKINALKRVNSNDNDSTWDGWGAVRARHVARELSASLLPLSWRVLSPPAKTSLVSYGLA